MVPLTQVWDSAQRIERVQELLKRIRVLRLVIASPIGLSRGLDPNGSRPPVTQSGVKEPGPISAIDGSTQALAAAMQLRNRGL
jgi:hypothetical protein